MFLYFQFELKKKRKKSVVQIHWEDALFKATVLINEINSIVYLNNFFFYHILGDTSTMHLNVDILFPTTI